MAARQIAELPGFNRWWSAWPKNVQGGYSRKCGKSHCIIIWWKNHHESQADTIVKHVEWLKTTADWLKDGGAFIPMPITYLRQQRWDGADIPEAPAASAPTDTEAYMAREAEHKRLAREEAMRRRRA